MVVGTTADPRTAEPDYACRMGRERLPGACRLPGQPTRRSRRVVPSDEDDNDQSTTTSAIAEDYFFPVVPVWAHDSRDVTTIASIETIFALNLELRGGDGTGMVLVVRSTSEPALRQSETTRSRGVETSTSSGAWRLLIAGSCLSGGLLGNDRRRPTAYRAANSRHPVHPNAGG